ncbi:MAG: acylphosphatase [Candidatus Dormibacteraeota bacterium]|nr:acylphosphatase [Candidatus Dormibacteraeota bacterium]
MSEPTAQPEQVAVRCRIGGRVQMVGFRAFTVTWASRLGVTGWVRNVPDGTVELWAQGQQPAVEELLLHVRVGPAAASVEVVQEMREQPRPGLTGFSDVG